MRGCVQALLRMGTCIVTLLLFTFIFGPWQLALSLFGMLPAMVLMILLLMITVLGGEPRLHGSSPSSSSIHHANSFAHFVSPSCRQR